MLILADENIPFSKEAFGHIGQVETFNGRALQNEDLKNANILLVRSITKVNESLLKDTPVQFVGSATIGFDHIDLNYLQKHNITFSRAPGCNAISAAEYVVSSLLILAKLKGFNLQDKTVGVIGCGNVGSRVIKRLEVLGVQCLPHDPPLQEETGDTKYVNRDTVLGADIISMHVPLITSGKHPTLHLANKAFFEKLSNNGIFINTSRGDVVVENELLYKLKTQPTFNAILDVWENEPNIDPELLTLASIASPHIAGYSLDGKVRGTEMIYHALCKDLNIAPQWKALDGLPKPGLLSMSFSENIDNADLLYQAVTSCYDSRDDDSLLRQTVIDKKQGLSFDGLRKNYRARREFSCLQINLANDKVEISQQLSQLGFNTKLL
ncbi:MAG: 4-phosphoerythronate dehydrogenase [Gammaproteobacteria bacterium]|nr:4-phosphoerythronate dehydrogenase [Gammaproteobacteria bacterium]